MEKNLVRPSSFRGSSGRSVRGLTHIASVGERLEFGEWRYFVRNQFVDSVSLAYFYNNNCS